jgi:hypothetical protein
LSSAIVWITGPIDRKGAKHIFAIKHSMRMGTLKEVDKLPAEVHSNIKKQSADPKSYLDDEYSF